jgi:hypothetical protein
MVGMTILPQRGSFSDEEADAKTVAEAMVGKAATDVILV